MSVIVKVHGTGGGGRTPHDGRYVRSWNPHTRYGILDLSSTADPFQARRFADLRAVLEEQRTVSHRERRRPDGRENRPLTGINIEIVRLPS